MLFRSVYPAGAMESRRVELNQPHEIVLRVRGTLINVAIDGQHSIAYRMPFARQPGGMELITFDAKAEFLSFELNELSPAFVLQDTAAPGSKDKASDGPLPLDQAKLAMAIAEKSLVTAGLQPASIRARSEADRVRGQDPAPADRKSTRLNSSHT